MHIKIYPYFLHISFGNSQQRDYDFSMLLYFYFNFTLRARGDLCYIYNNAYLSKLPVPQFQNRNSFGRGEVQTT